MSIERTVARTEADSRRRGRICRGIALTVLLLLGACGPSKQKQLDVQQAVNRFQLGSRFMGQGMLRRAVKELQHAVELDPRNDRYHSGLGQAYLFLGDLTLAKTELRKAIKINPALTEAHHNLALVYSELGEYESAEEEYTIALSNPAYFTPEKIYLNWGSTLEKKGDSDAALEKMLKAVALNPRYARGHRTIGELFELRGDMQGALNAYLEAYKFMPQVPEFNLKLAEIYMQQGKPGEARRFLEMVVETAAPESSEAIRAQAYLEDLPAG